MLYVHNTSDNITLPSGVEMTPEEIAEDAFFKPLATDDCIVDIDDKGIIHWFEPVESLKADYGITGIDEPNAVLVEVNRIRDEVSSKVNFENATVADLQAQMNALSGYTG